MHGATLESLRRRLAAILAADVVGYSRLMAADEAATVKSLDAARAIFRRHIENHGGQLIDTAGDSVLSVFNLATGAVEAAVAIQNELTTRSHGIADERRMQFRIGVHLGEINEKDDGTVYGDGVNTAARLQSLASPGGITVSQSIQGAVRGKINASFEDQGEHLLKNIPEPLRAFRVANAPGRQGEVIDSIVTSNGKPSIAVLPFNNMSSDPDQDYFVDGMVEDIITELSRSRGLFVIARNSSFTFKGRAVDVRQVGRELGVRYVLEGSVRKTSARVRVTGQLIDASNGAHLWAERYEGQLEDIFDLQDKITSSVVGAIIPTLEQVEIARSKRKPPDSLDAYDYYLRGLAQLHQWNKAANLDASLMFRKAIELSPEFSPAYGAAAYCHCQRKASGWVTDRAAEIVDARPRVDKAIELGKDDAEALARAAHALAYVLGDLDGGKVYSERALAMNPNLSYAWFASAWVHIWLGDPESGLKRSEQAMRLSPLDPLLPGIRSQAAMAHFFAGRNDEAVRVAEQVLQEKPDFFVALRAAAVSHALAGRHEAAQKAMLQIRRIDPTLRVSNLHLQTSMRRPEDQARYAEAMRIAGLPP
jgi:adenylate cyclase